MIYCFKSKSEVTFRHTVIQVQDKILLTCVLYYETLYNMYAVGCSVSARGKPRGAKASGDSSHVTVVAGIGLVQM